MEKQKRKNEFARPNIFASIFSVLWIIVSSIGKGIGYAIQQIATGIWWLVKNAAEGAWWAITMIASGAWYVRGQAWQLFLWIIKQPYRLLRYIISGRIPDFENARQEEIFWRIKRQYRRKRLFLINSLLYGFVLFVSLVTIGMRYREWQLAELSGETYVTWLQASFYNTLAGAGFMMGIWTLVLIGHFVFNRMGDAEDQALGAALEPEYARSEAIEERYHRLVETPDDYENYFDEKPKRNGAYQ